MTAEDLLPRLEAVRRSSRGYRARCPAHDDKTPSLSVRDGERGVLVKCWAGCHLQDITAAIGLTVRDLFYDQAQDPRVWRKARQQQLVEREWRGDRDYLRGLITDTRREADCLLASARNPSLAGWNDEDLDVALNAVADAYEIRFAEKVEHGEYPF
jgi:hypothetical protein